MVQASESTGLFQRLGTPLLRPEKLLRLPIRLESAKRIAITYGRDDDVALEDVAISTRALRAHVLPACASQPQGQCIGIGGGVFSMSHTQ